MTEYIEIFNTPDGKYNVIVEVDFKGQVVSVRFEETDSETLDYD